MTLLRFLPLPGGSPPPPPPPPPNFSLMPPKSRVFTFAELKSATNDFSRSLIIGEGGFGCVFKGRIKNHIMIDVAVKQLNKKGLQGHRQWITEVNFLGIANHPNLVKLVGYCAEDDERGAERLLVYEFMPNKSVLDHLSPQSKMPLSWPMRLKIALGSARGLTYLHEEMSLQVVGTLGYAAPEYLRTGHLTAKSDIWSYGIVLYELITGRRPFEQNRPKGEQKLLEWVRPCISDIKKFPRILDPRLAGDGQFSMNSALQLAAVANRCLVRDPKFRPKMSEVLEMVKMVDRNGISIQEFGSNRGSLG